MSTPSPQWITLARLLRPRGNKGELAALILTDFPERLTRLSEVHLSDGKGQPRPAVVKRCWLSQNHKGQAVFHFAGCDSINDAEKFRGLDVQIPFEQRVKLPENVYFIADLKGCSVFEISANASALASPASSALVVPALLGVIRDVETPGEGVSGTPMLVVETASGELLIPLAVDICTRIDTTARRVEVTLPEGLRELNRG
ncbi:MAG: ribosome maturation factor RimM [Candidatus Acidiferrum sp.]